MALFDGDLLVYGGGLAGVAAACEAAAAGRSVCLVERRTYLGGVQTAALRPWLAPEDLPSAPDPLKLALEDRLLASGVELLYGARPVGVQRLGDRYQVELVGKFGRQVVTAVTIVDASEQADLARLVPGVRALKGSPEAGPGRDGSLVRYWRTAELTGVDLAGLEGGPAVPPEVTPDCRLHPGCLTEQGQVFVEHALDLPPAAGSSEAEIEARLVTRRLVRWLKERHPAFAAARWIASSQELAAPRLWQVTNLPAGIMLVGDGAASAPVAAPAAAPAATPAAAPAPAPAPAPLVAPQRRQVDVLVIGGGTSGVAAAVGASRHGARTLLVEMNHSLGGTGTVGGVDSYWFGRRGGFNAEVASRVEAEHAWMKWQGGKWSTEGKMMVWLDLARTAGVDLLLQSVLVEVRRTPEGRVTGALIASRDGLIEVEARVTVDATGDGDVAVQAGADWVYGSDREGVSMWYSLAAYVRPGVTKNNFTSTVDVGDPRDYTRAVLSGRRRLVGHDHGPYIAPRESRHIIGEVRLTLTDILTMRKWPDVVNLHFSNHDIKGHNTSDWLRMGLIPPNLEVEIPYRALIPAKVEGLLITGKAISATHDALPPIRMQADLENLGYVCGTAAGLCAARSILPRRLPVGELQQLLAAEGVLPPALAARGALSEAAPTEAEMRGWIQSLDDSYKLLEYSNMEMSDVRREPIPMVMICTAGPRILPLLREAVKNPDLPGRLMAARALAWYGDEAATPVLLEAIRSYLTDETLPRRTEHILYSQASPDHGAMPQLAYLLHSAAMVRDRRCVPLLAELVDRLHPTKEGFEDHHSGLFNYVDAICDIAERLGDPDAIPALRRLHALDLLHGNVSTAVVQPDFFEERLAYLDAVIGRALARCGDIAGLQTLIGYLSDSRRMLVRHAHQELMAITGQRLPADPAAWEAWAAGVKELPPAPVLENSRG